MIKLNYPKPETTTRPDIPVADAYLIGGNEYEVVDGNYFSLPFASDVEPDETVTPLSLLCSVDHGLRTADETAAVIGIYCVAETYGRLVDFFGGDSRTLDYWSGMTNELGMPDYSGGWADVIDEETGWDGGQAIYEWCDEMESAARDAGVIVETSSDAGMTWLYAPMTAPIDDAIRFFWHHAGTSYRPGVETVDEGRHRGAVALARAEQWADENGVVFEWAPDWDVVDHAAEYDCYDEGGPESCETCTALDENGDVLASLGCIDDATDEYRRVVQAELALEAHAVLAARWADVERWLSLG